MRRHAHVAEPGLAAVTRAGVDPGEVDHGGDSSARAATAKWLKNPSVAQSNRTGVSRVIVGVRVARASRAGRRHGGASHQTPDISGSGGRGSMEIVSDGPTLVLSGDFDVRSTWEVRNALHERLHDHEQDVVVDLTDVRTLRKFVDRAWCARI